MDVTQVEAKGLVYEAFVKLALEISTIGTIEWHPSLPGVRAEQDFAVRHDSDLGHVFGVTFWGSHEAAKMKFWRIHEDIFEVLQAHPGVRFFHVLFEKNSDSDANLAALVSCMCAGAALSDTNCPAIPVLQKYVATDEAIATFGRGLEAINDHCHLLYQNDPTFYRCIQELGASISSAIQSTMVDDHLIQVVDAAVPQNSNQRTFEFSGARSTMFKPALILLLDLGLARLRDLCEADRRGDFATTTGFQEYLQKGLLLKAGITDSYYPKPELRQLLDMGEGWCTQQLKRMENQLSNENHPAHAYLEHYRDVTDEPLRARRLQTLLAASSPEVVEALLLDKLDMRDRCWPLDYFMALEREHTRGRKFGFQRLSTQLDIEYMGGISDLPQFARGHLDKLSTDQIIELTRAMHERMRHWRPELTSGEVIKRDRMVTLMKQLPVLDLLVESTLCEMIPGIELRNGFSVPHPMSSRVKNKGAGRTEFNFLVQGLNRPVILFVVSSFEATHKHKELSGRLRAAWASGLDPRTECLLLVDGNFLAGDTYTERIEMMKRAGWAGAYFMDELAIVAKRLLS